VAVTASIATTSPLTDTDAFVLEQLPGAAWTTDRELRITSLRGEVERNLGLPSARIVGLNVADIARTRARSDPAIAAHRAALEGERSAFRYELRKHCYDVTVAPLRDGSNTIIGCIGCAVDVTKRVEAEQRAADHEAELVRSLRRTISLLEATLESTADGLLVIDPGGKVAAYNQRFAVLWQIPRPLLDRRDDRALLSFVLEQLEDPDDFMRGVHSLYGHPRAESLDLVRFRDGRVFERYSRPQCIGDEIIGRVWSFRDVSEREDAARRLRLLAEASRLLTTLDIETALDAVAHLVVASLADACVIGVVLDGEQRKVATAARHIEQPRSIPAFPLTESRTIIHEVSGRTEAVIPLLSLGASVGAISVTGLPGRTLSDREIEVVEELARRCATAVESERLSRHRAEEVHAREEFLAVAAHEFRSPLTVISLAAAALSSGIGNQAHLIGEIERESRHMGMLVDELLDAARLRAGRLRLALETVDLVAVIRAVIHEHDYALERSGSRLTFDGPPALLGRWDHVRIHQVIANLLSNAIKFGDGKPIEIAVSATEHRATLSVIDRGIGIPHGELATLFEPFARATPARRYGGLGLGLFIVHRIVESLGGKLEVRSVVGEGSTFTVTLPRGGHT
jgi:PAS domain S-box-containing protein